MMATPNLPITRRPSPSQADSEMPPTDVESVLGGVMASQARIERALANYKQENDTFQSSVMHLQRTVDDLLDGQQKMTRAMQRLGKLAPTLIAVFEVLRQVAAHYLPGGIHP